MAVNSQVAGRVHPNITDLLVALASGAAGAFGLSRRNVSDALPGVAIAISLVPPLCVAGVMLANHDPGASADAMLLFVTNFLAILIAGGVLLGVMGYGRAAVDERARGRRTAAVVIGVTTLAVAVPLALTGRQIAQDGWREFQVQSNAAANLPPGYDLVGVTASDDTIDVTVEGPPGDITENANEIAAAVHADYPTTTVRVSLVATQIVEIAPKP